MSTSHLSDFYLACRNNEINRVKQMLSQMSVDEINRIEITRLGNSTALHAASFNGRYEVVELLLKHGADPTILNFDRSTAADEAKTIEIQRLFTRDMMAAGTINDRFGRQDLNLEWVLFDSNVVTRAKRYRQWLEAGSRNMPYSCHTIIHDYLEKERLRGRPRMDRIKELFELAAKKDDPKRIVRAYTMQTEFYRCLNEDLAATTTDSLNSNAIYDFLFQGFWNNHGRVAAIIARHPNLKTYFCDGICYRGTRMTDQQLFHHKVGIRIMTKTLSSCSRKLEIAMKFATQGFNPKNQIYPTLCQYEIINRPSALYIASISAFPSEEEVLIVPFTVFEITRITWRMFEVSMDNGTTTKEEGREIQLREC